MKPYKAAGILPFLQTDHGAYALLAFEENRGSWRCKYHRPGRPCQEGAECSFLHIDTPECSPDEREMNRLNFLGGKREPGDADAATTAAREFHEETHGLVPLAAAHALTRSVVQRTRGHYDLFLGWLAPTENMASLAQRYAALPRAPPLACALELVWVTVAELTAVVGWNATMGYHLAVNGRHWPITNLLWSFLEQHRNMITDFVKHY